MAIRQFTARSLRRVAGRLDPSLRFAPCPPPPLEARSAPGSRKASMFFDGHPHFAETSRTAASLGRLNLRYEAIFGENRDILDGARVLDIASHDGRWSLAALETDARSVVGVEARPRLVADARANLERCGYGADQVTFVRGDVHEVINGRPFEADVVLCLGFLYHTLRYNELLAGIRRTGARHIVFDTQAPNMMQPEPAVRPTTENVVKQRDAAKDRYSCGTTALTGRPNLAAIRIMLDAYGYAVEQLSDWGGLLRDNPDIGDCADYARQQRITFRCVDRTAVTEGSGR